VKVIVTGGAGFIGSHLVDLLVDSAHDVIVIDNLSTGHIANLEKVLDKITFVNDDIRSHSIRRLFSEVDCVFHLAALADIVPSIDRPREYLDVNVMGTCNVLEFSRENAVKKFIYAASSSCYGLPKEFPTSEKSPIDTRYPYALSKFLGEQEVIHWSQVYGINAISLRLFNVYGPRARTSGNYGAVFGVFLAQRNNKMPLTIVGDGTQMRDFTYVKDVVRAFELARQSKITGQVVNIGSSVPSSVNYLAELIGGERVHIPKRPGEPDITHADINLAKDLLGWTPTTSIDEGVKILLKNLSSWKDAPVWTPEAISKETKSWFKYLK
jgi:UDP-glucose 4-epimerase